MHVHTSMIYTFPSCAGEDEPIYARYAKEVEEAIKRNGSVEIEASKMVFLGPPEAGKTQLKYALMGKYEKSTTSTPFSAGAKQVVEHYVENDDSTSPCPHWKVFTKEMFREALLKSAKDENDKKIDKSASFGSAPHFLQHNSQLANPDSNSGSADPDPNSDNANPDPNSGSANPDPKSGSANPDPNSGGANPDTSDQEQQPSSVKEPSAEVGDPQVNNNDEFAQLNVAVQKLLDGSAKKDLGKMRYIHLIDNGGQPAFFDAHPVVATSRATYVLVYNMQEGLNAMPKYTYRKKGCTKDDEVHIAAIPNEHCSNLDLLKQSLRTVENLKHKFEHFESQVCSNVRPPYVVVVGTRYSEPGREGAGTIEEQNKQLSKECSLYPAWDDAQKYKDMYIFPVDCFKPNCPGVQAVRDRISCDGFSLKLTIPISWFKCHLILWYAKEKRVDSGEQKPSQLEVLPYSAFFQLCHEQRLISNRREMLAMVRAFHMLGLFFFPAFKPVEEWEPKGDEPVFTNPDLLYAELTKILEITFEKDFPRVPYHADDNRLLNQLKVKGELTREIMGRLDIPDKLDHFPDFHRFLLHQLITWGLAAELPTSISQDSMVETAANDPVYFVPCILQPFQGQSDHSCSEPDPGLGYIYLTIYEKMSTYYILNGAFTHFIINLLRPRKYSLAEVRSEKQNRCSDSVALTTTNENSNKFKYNVRVTNIKLECIRVCISPVNPKRRCPYDYHQIIWGELKVALEDACKHMYCKTEMPFPIVVATVCKSQSHSNTDSPHLAKLLTECPCGTTDPSSANYKPSDVSCLCQATEYDLDESPFLKEVKDACKSKYHDTSSSMYCTCVFHFCQCNWGSCTNT